MPYKVEPKDGKFCVYNTETGKKVGEHNLRRDAIKQMSALAKAEEKKAKEGDIDGPGDGVHTKKTEKQKQIEHEEDHDY